MFAPPGLTVSRHNERQNIEIALDPEVFGWCWRRGRHHLRDIQTSSQATLKLDRARCVIRMTGTEDSIAEAVRQFECFCFTRRAVTAAVWAELLRARASSDLSHSAMARIQHESGCRIHVKRDAQEVRIYGPKQNRIIAERLLDELQCMCIEEEVHIVGPLANLDLQTLQTLEQEFSVTLQPQEMCLTITGIEGAVVETANAFRSYKCDDLRTKMPNDIVKSSIAARWAISAAMSKLTAGTDEVDLLEDAALAVDIPPTVLQSRSVTEHQKAQTATSPLRVSLLQQACDICPACGTGNFCFNCGRPSQKMPDTAFAGCKTCGVVNFCVFCGQPTKCVQDTEETWESCGECGSRGNYCFNCGTPTGRTLQCPHSSCPVCGVVEFCVNCGHPTNMKKAFGNMLPILRVSC